MAIIFQTQQLGEADFQVWMAPTIALADLWVYAEEDRFLMRGDQYWVITQNRNAATSLIYFGHRGAADFSMIFVPEWGMAGWKRPVPHVMGKL